MPKGFTSIPIIFAGALVLAVAIFGIAQKQPTQKLLPTQDLPSQTNKAASVSTSGPVTFSLQTTSLIGQVGQTTQVAVLLTSQEHFTTEASGVDIDYDPELLDISTINCSQTFAGTNRTDLSNSRLRLSCFRPPDTDPLQLNPGVPVELGTFTVTFRKPGQARLTFSRTVISGPTFKNMAGGSTPLEFTITGL